MARGAIANGVLGRSAYVQASGRPFRSLKRMASIAMWLAPV